MSFGFPHASHLPVASAVDGLGRDASALIILAFGTSDFGFIALQSLPCDAQLVIVPWELTVSLVMHCIDIFWTGVVF